MIKINKKNRWRCNGCASEIIGSYSYYCFECDLDVCLNCFMKSNGKNPKNNNHPHELSVKNLSQTGFGCDSCKSKNDKYMLRFRCNSCDFDICFKCRY